MTSLTLVFSDIVLNKTTGLKIKDIKEHFETSVKEIETLNETLEDVIGDGRLIIFIDDLDRCSIDNTLDILESMKLIFNAKNTKFVVAADMKKLETAWALKHKGQTDPLHEGKEHLDKIFQIKLSLPPKAFFPKAYPKEGDYSEANRLITLYLQDITRELPEEIMEFIAAGFPPNPRKIKRALSLAYFIAKNIEIREDIEYTKTFPTGFKDMFPLILIWSVATSYFSELAETIKNAPYLLIHVCAIIAITYISGTYKQKCPILNLPNRNGTKRRAAWRTTQGETCPLIGPLLP